MKDLHKHLAPTVVIEADHPEVIGEAHRLTEGCHSAQEQAVKLFYFVSRLSKNLFCRRMTIDH